MNSGIIPIIHTELERQVGDRLLDDVLLTVTESADRTTWSRTKLYDLMNSGKLAYVTVGRSRRIPRFALVELLARGFHPAQAE
jgi:excisionase family DNA binding protein